MTSSTQMLAVLAERLNLSDLSPNEQGLCALTIDRDVTVFLKPIAEASVALFAGIGSVPADKAGPTCRALLESNHFWNDPGSFSLCLAPGTLDVLLCGRLEAAGAGPDEIGEVFDRFVVHATAWRRRLPILLDTTPQAAVTESIRDRDGPAERASPDASEMIFRI